MLEDNRPATEGMKYKRAMQYHKKVMNEDEFEEFCKLKLRNPEFTLGGGQIGDDTSEKGGDGEGGNQAAEENRHSIDIFKECVLSNFSTAANTSNKTSPELKMPLQSTS